MSDATLRPYAVNVSQAGEEMRRELREANEKLLVAGVREQELAERASDAVRQFTALLETMTEGVTVFDGRGEVLLVNEVGRSILGCFTHGAATADDYYRCSLLQLDRTPIDFRSMFLDRLLRGEQFADEEVVLLHPETGERRLVFSGNAVRRNGGAVTLAINTYRDITEMRLLEQMREQYVSLISHDLLGPLSAATMAAQILARSAEDGDRRRIVGGRLLVNLDRMATMVRDLLDAHRVRAGHPLRLDLGECDLMGIVREVVEDLGTLHGDRFVVRGDPALRGYWSGEHLRRAIWNLLANAVKHGEPDEPIAVTVEHRGGFASLSVHNRGTPIPPEDLPFLFHPFSRSRVAVESGRQGWGLGLTLVRGCAEAHGGTVSAVSDASGTVFTVLLPLQRPENGTHVGP